jgi:hypothetical protein
VKKFVLPMVASEVLSVTVLATGQKAKFSRNQMGASSFRSSRFATRSQCFQFWKFEFASTPQTVSEPDTAAWITGSLA